MMQKVCWDSIPLVIVKLLFVILCYHHNRMKILKPFFAGVKIKQDKYFQSDAVLKRIHFESSFKSSASNETPECRQTQFFQVHMMNVKLKYRLRILHICAKYHRNFSYNYKCGTCAHFAVHWAWTLSHTFASLRLEECRHLWEKHLCQKWELLCSELDWTMSGELSKGLLYRFLVGNE